MSAGRMYVKQVSERGQMFVAMTPDALHARANLCAERHGALAEKVRRAAWDGPLGRFDRLRAASRRLIDFAWACQREADALRVKLSRSVAQEFLVECSGCSEPYDIEATEQIGNDRFCRGCAHQVRIEMAECMRSDEHDFHYDRGC